MAPFKVKIIQLSNLYRLAFFSSLLGIFIFIADFGFDQGDVVQGSINAYYFFVLIVGIVASAVRYLSEQRKIPLKVLVFDVGSILFTIGVLIVHFFFWHKDSIDHILYNDNWIKFAIILTFIRELSEKRINYKRTVVNPAQLFIMSFMLIILLGAFMLMLPNATKGGISFLDALFTSTSAVCVTGLAVVDTGTFFTEFGQTIILVLIQIGGLGILTFASYFSYFFKGGSTYENQLSLGEMTNSQKIGEVFSTLKRILIITFSIEIVGGILIYTSLDERLLGSFMERFFFSLFHSVSAFCNAGFSTLSSGLYDSGYRFNYGLQLTLIALFVLGGLGFPIVVNLLKYFKYLIKTRIIHFGKRYKHKPWVLNLNSRITLITTIALTVIGTIIIFFTEYSNTMSEHGPFGKFVTALFTATTPRTAGFNTVDMGALNFSTVMLIFLLMWVGASPASTGGGIKTSTFAIATMNFFSLARGKTRIEVYRREIADISVRRAFAVISLSLVVIGTGIIFMSYFDHEKSLISIAFECFSAYSTVGLSIGITADLTPYSKFVIIVIMFIGRVSMLSIMIAIFNKVKHKNYRYPTEEITIN